MTVSLIFEEVEQTPGPSSLFFIRCDGMAAAIIKWSILWSKSVIIEEKDNAPTSQAVLAIVEELIKHMAGREFLEQPSEEVVLLTASSGEEYAMREWAAAFSSQRDGRLGEVYFAVSAVGLRAVKWCIETVDRFFEGDDLHAVIGADRDETDFLVRRIEVVKAASIAKPEPAAQALFMTLPVAIGGALAAGGVVHGLPLNRGLGEVGFWLAIALAYPTTVLFMLSSTRRPLRELAAAACVADADATVYTFSEGNSNSALGKTWTRSYLTPSWSSTGGQSTHRHGMTGWEPWKPFSPITVSTARELK